MDEAKVAELAATITVSGLLQPIAVRPRADGRFSIIAGHRRTAAFRQLLAGATTDAGRAKYATIPAQVMTALDDGQMAVSGYVENAQRENLNPVEEGAALARIRELTNAKTPNDIAALTGQEVRKVRRLLRVAEAPAVVKDGVTKGLMVVVSDEAGEHREHRHLDLMAALEFVRLHAYFAKVKPKAAGARVEAVVKRALGEGWGFRRLEGYVEAVLAGRAPREETPSEPVAAPLYEASPKRFVLHLSRLSEATPEAVVAARAAFEAALAEAE
jgi:ParB/RepB/Spo0J family partition protein